MFARAACGCFCTLFLGGVLACNGSGAAGALAMDGAAEAAPGAGDAPDGGASEMGDAPDDGIDPTIAALPVCASFVNTGSTLPVLSPHVTQGGPGWGNGSHLYTLVAPTADGWTLTLESGMPGADRVSDPGNLLAGLGAGDRITVNGEVECQTASGCKEYDIIRNAADGTLIEASYFHDSATYAFSWLLGVGVSFEPVCRSADTDSCFPGAIRVQNRLRFAGNSAPIAAGATGSIVLGAQTVRVSAGMLLTLSGGDRGICLDAGSFFRGEQAFSLAR